MMIELKHTVFSTWPILAEDHAITIQKNLSHAEIDALETFHLNRNIHPLFLLISLHPYSATDERLAQRGYGREGEMVVMTREIRLSAQASDLHIAAHDHTSIHLAQMQGFQQRYHYWYRVHPLRE